MQGHAPRYAESFVRDFLEYGEVSAGSAVIAECGGDVVAFLRYKCGYARRVFYARGTWVRAAFRKYGIAGELWGLALKVTDPEIVQVSAASAKGLRLVRSLEQQHSAITWEVTQIF